MSRLLFICFILFGSSVIYAENLLIQIDKKLSPGSSESYKKLINIEPDGTKKEFLLYQARKDNDKMVSAFLQPESEKGRTTLRVGDNMWLYLPDVGRAIRVTSMQSVIGGVLGVSGGYVSGEGGGGATVTDVPGSSKSSSSGISFFSCSSWSS